jgi:hypothetical protein
VNFGPLLVIAHWSTGILLFALAMISVSMSVLIAVKPAADPTNAKLLRKANIVGLTESIVAGIVALTGLIAVFIGSWSLSELWLWLSLVIMLFYLTALKRVTKPARQVVAVGGSAIKSGMQVILQIAHLLLLLVAFLLMFLKPA